MFSEKVLKDIIQELLQARLYESDNIDNSLIMFRSYTMALEDVYHRLTGKELKLDQDLATSDIGWF